ncbi:putative membrane transporter protein YfcA [subsurface metagenome]
MEWYLYIAVIGVGLLTGFINTLAAGGSLLSLPFLIFLGLPANVANGTNRIAILLQNIVSVGSFKQQRILNPKEGIWIAVPAIIGSLIGAQIAINFDEEVMRKTIGGLLLVMFFIIMIKPDKWIKGQEGEMKSRPSVFQIIIFFFIGIYGGFIQAGVGFFLLAGLVLGAGADLIKANALKVFIILLYTPFALFIFILHHQVDYKLGLILAVGNMAGAYLGAKYGVRWGIGFVRYVLLAAIFFSAAKLIGVIEYIGILMFMA